MKKKNLIGFLQGVSYMANMTEIQKIILIQKAIDDESWKGLGFETAKEFVKAATGSSYDAFYDRSKKLKQLGAEVIGIIVNLGWGMKEVRMIEHALIEDPKTNKKAIKIDENRQIPFSEERKDELQTAVDLLREQRDSERKEAKRIQSKLNGLESEHKKEISALTKKINELIPEDKDRKWAEKHLQKVNDLFLQVDLALRSIAFDDRIWDDPKLQGEIQGLNDALETRFFEFRKDFRKAIDEHYGE